MAVDFTIPKLGDNVKNATIVSWLVTDGAEVNAGDDVIELETDKAVIPVPASASGTIKLGPYAAGAVVPIGAVVATIGSKGGVFSPGAAPAEATTAPETPVVSAPAPEPADAAPKTTPVAQKMAAEMGVDLNTVSGSGVHGKITKTDVLHAVVPAPVAPVIPPRPEPAALPVPQPAPLPPAAPANDVLERVPVKGIRGVVARRMAESVQTTARVTLVTEVDATELVNLREQLKSRYAEAWGFAPGYNDLLTMIVANGLRQFPYMNARFSADGAAIEYLQPINIGLAVDTDRGLLVTVVRDLDKKGLQEIGREYRDLISRAKNNKSGPADLTGSTFTISSLGIYRVDAFTPVINLPEAAILGVGRIADKPVVKDGQIVARKMLTLSLVFDHRLVDGAPAARFLDYLCEMIEEPYMLFLTRK